MAEVLHLGRRIREVGHMKKINNSLSTKYFYTIHCTPFAPDPYDYLLHYDANLLP